MSCIYVTGSSGMLGHYLSELLSSAHRVVGCDLVDVGAGRRTYDFHKFDLTDFSLLEKKVSEIAPDVIVHTAAFIDVDRCEREREKAFFLNGDITAQLVKIADKIGARLIYISTDAVFDGALDRAYTENDAVHPLNIYGASKQAGEEAVLSGAGQHTVLRTNIYGWNIQEKRSFAEWVYESLKEKTEITMFTDWMYSPIYVGDFSRIVRSIIEKNVSGLYHAAGGEHSSKFIFAQILADVFLFDKNCIRKGTARLAGFKAQRNLNARLDSSRLSRDLNIELPGVLDGLRVFKENESMYERN